MLETGQVGNVVEFGTPPQGRLPTVWVIEGAVQAGQRIGRTIGFPTANVAMDEGSLLPHGIYVSVTRVNGGRRRGSISYLGRRPTVRGSSLLLEAHIFDFDQTIYGMDITVELHDRIRGDSNFDGLENLRRQIEKDCAIARLRLADLLEPAATNEAWPVGGSAVSTTKNLVHIGATPAWARNLAGAPWAGGAAGEGRRTSWDRREQAA